MMEALLQDVRYGARMLLRNPAFSAVVIAILALGIGANTAVFSVVNAVVLRPLPYTAPDRIYELSGQSKTGSRWISAPDFLTWRERTRVFEAMAAARNERFLLSGVEAAEEVAGLGLGRECLPTLGVPPVIGRAFTDEDYRDGAPRTALLGHRLWMRQWGGDPRVLGKNILLNGQPHTVVGVMPPEFQFPNLRYEVWVPMTFDARALSRREWPAFMVWARLKPGARRQQAEEEARILSSSLAREFPASHARTWMVVASFQERMTATLRPTLLVLLGAVGFVLLIACLNVANMLLARASERSKEIAIRASLGAGRWRLVRQMVTESALLAIAGGALGLLVAAWGNRALLALYPEKIPMPRLEQSRVDTQVLWFTLLLAVASGVVFGLAPALYASGANLVERLKESGRGEPGGCRVRSRSLLIVAETALSLVLLTGAGLMIQSFVRLMRVNPGFNPERLVTVRLPLPTFRITDKKRQPLYYAQLLEQVRTIPGVRTAALATVLPLGGIFTSISLEKPIVPGKREERPSIAFRAVSAEYFRVMGIPVLMGRAFGEADTAQAPPVLIVNEAMAREYWPNESPIGKVVPVAGSRSIVGVVGNVKHASLSGAAEAEVYFPFLQMLGLPHSALVARTAVEPEKLIAAVQKKIREWNPDQPVNEAKSMRQLVSESVSQPRFYMLLLSIFAGLALALAAAGIYGVMSYSVSRREHEIGIRMAVGASAGDVLRLVIRQGAQYVLIGIVLGAAGAAATTRLIANLLFGVAPTDVATYAAVSLVLLSVALLACYVPARRAARVDPMVALRHE